MTWFVWYSSCIMYGFRDCELCTFFPLFHNSRHSMINLRNVLHVWSQYELRVETETLLCMLHCVQTMHNRTKTYVVKSLFVCNIVDHVLQIVVVWLQLIIWECLFTQCGQSLINFFLFLLMFNWYKIKPSRFKMARIFEKSTIDSWICCRAWCCVIKQILY